MTVPSGAEVTLLRTQPHRTDLYLSIYKPRTVFQARVNDSGIVKGEREINYDGASGNYQHVIIGMTLYVGTTPGGKDKGSIYVYGINPLWITVGENSHIDWADNDYLTVVLFYQIWPVYPRYTQDGENITVYKAFDTAYTNQNEIGGTFICMGPHHAGFLENGQHRIFYSSNGTEQVESPPNTLAYSWIFEGGTPTGSTLSHPGYVTYNTPGHYFTQLTITSSSGAVDRSIRHISIYNRPGEGPNIPIMNWGMESLTGVRDEGGYTARLWVEEDVDDIEDGALVVIFADDWYGETKQSIGGNSPSRESIVFVGYILGSTIDYDYQRNRIFFDVGSPTAVMKLGEAFSVSVQDSTNPIADASNPEKGGDPWFYYVGLNIRSALYHYIRWHSSIFRCMDIEYMPNHNPALQFFDADRTNLYEALYNLMRSAVYGSVISDRQGKLHFEIEPAATHDPGISFNNVWTLDKQDWLGTPQITERYSNELSYLEGGGIGYWGLASGTDSFQPLLASAPGVTPAYRGAVDKLSGLALTSQSQLNTLVGDIYAWRNSRYPQVDFDLVGNFRFIDIVPEEIIKVSMNPADNFRGIQWVTKRFGMQSVEWTYDSLKGLFLPHISLAECPVGVDGDSIIIPLVPPEEGFDQPPRHTPPAVPPSPSPLPGGGGGGSSSFIPATGASNGPFVDAVLAVMSFAGAQCDPGVHTAAGGGNIGGGSFTPIISVNGVGTLPYCKCTAQVFNPVTGALVSTTSAGFTQLTPPSVGQYYEETDLTVSVSASSGYIVHIYFERNGTHGSDSSTAAGILHMLGWKIG